MRAFFEGIEDLFVNFLFLPYDFFRLTVDSWTVSNAVNWGFLIIGFIAMVYWMGQLNKFNKNNEEDKSISSHSFL